MLPSATVELAPADADRRTASVWSRLILAQHGMNFTRQVQSGRVTQVRPLGEPGWARQAGSTQSAVPTRVLRQVLLVVVLCVIEGAGRADLGGDGAIPRLAQHLLVHITSLLGSVKLRVTAGLGAGPGRRA